MLPGLRLSYVYLNRCATRSSLLLPLVTLDFVTRLPPPTPARGAQAVESNDDRTSSFQDPPRPRTISLQEASRRSSHDTVCNVQSNSGLEGNQRTLVSES